VAAGDNFGYLAAIGDGYGIIGSPADDADADFKPI
jgi:hypothetical protein